MLGKHLYQLSCLTTILMLTIFQAEPTQTAVTDNKNLAVIFIIDDSGSMAKNDPKDLRYQAARLFVASLDHGDRVGAIQFSNTARVITNGFMWIKDSKSKDELISLFAPVEPDGYTDVQAAFRKAAEIINGFSTPGYQRVIVFLTDGKPEVEYQTQNYELDTLELIQDIGVPVYAIALTPAGQTAFLSAVATKTNGLVVPCKEMNDILDSYLSILGELKDRSILGSGISQSPNSIQFHLDPALMPYVSKASFVVSKEESISAVLISPDGDTVSTSNQRLSYLSNSDTSFQVLTIEEPEGGHWIIDLEGRGDAQIRVILHTHLRIKLLTPGGLHEAGQPMLIEASLYEELADSQTMTIIGETLFAAQITKPGNISESLDRLYDDGTHGDRIADDGVFSRVYVNADQPGAYQITLKGRKGGIQLSATSSVEVIEFPEIVLSEPAETAYEIRDKTIPISMEIDKWGLRGFEGSFQTRVISPSGREHFLSMREEQGVYSTEFSPTESGDYLINIQAIHAFYRGVPYEHKLSKLINVMIVPLVSIEVPQLGESIETSFEVWEVKRGIPIRVAASSTADYDIPLTLTLNTNQSGLALENSTILIPPHAEASFEIQIVGSSHLTTGNWAGSLEFSSKEKVEIINPSHPLVLDIYQPKLSISGEITTPELTTSCFEEISLSLILTTYSSSKYPQKVSIGLTGLKGIVLAKETIIVPPGLNTLTVPVLTDEARAGRYIGGISFQQHADDLLMVSNPSQKISFSIPSLVNRCRRPLIFLGGAVLLATMIMSRTIKSIVKKMEPPKVSGTLIYWAQELPEDFRSANLTEMKKTTITIGSGSKCDVQISDHSINEIHLLVSAKKGENGSVRVILNPVEAITKGYQKHTEPLPLEDGERYQLGNHMIMFISDPDH